MNKITAKIKIIGECVRLSSQLSRSPIAPKEVSNQLNGPDAAMIMKTIAELRNARRKAPAHSFHLIVRYTNTPVNKPEKIEIGGTTETPSSLFKTDIVDTVVNDHQNKNRLKPVSLKMSPNAEEEVESDTQKKADEISSDGMSSPIEEMMI